MYFPLPVYLTEKRHLLLLKLLSSGFASAYCVSLVVTPLGSLPILATFHTLLLVLSGLTKIGGQQFVGFLAHPKISGVLLNLQTVR